MKYQEILKLLDNGYTREEILEMKDNPDDQGDMGNNDEAGTPPDMNDAIKEMRDMFKEMKKELIALNIMNSSQSGENAKTSEEIIANIISPNTKKKGDK